MKTGGSQAPKATAPPQTHHPWASLSETSDPAESPKLASSPQCDQRPVGARRLDSSPERGGRRGEEEGRLMQKCCFLFSFGGQLQLPTNKTSEHNGRSGCGAGAG